MNLPKRFVANCMFGITLLGTEAIGAESIPGTAALKLTQSIDSVMVDGINRFALRELSASPSARTQRWVADLHRANGFEAFAKGRRERLRAILGAIDPRVQARGIELIATTTADSLLAKNDRYSVYSVRWQVLPGVTAEGLLLKPTVPPRARVIALPDADWTPEAFAGLTDHVAHASQLARRLAEHDVEILVPTLINRDDTWSGNPEVALTNQPHREFVYRMAFELGRHIIGYEVQKVLAALDLLQAANDHEGKNVPLGVVGVSEGGLLALYSAALDPRIQATLVSGYFQPRESIWEEPIYHNVWGLLNDFGDAELAALIAPRALVIEGARVPEINGPPPTRAGRNGGAAPGRIVSARPEDVRREFSRIAQITPASFRERILLIESDGGRGLPGCDAALAAFLKQLGIRARAANGQPARLLRSPPDVADRQHRQFTELVEFTQRLLDKSAKVRDLVWSKADRSSAAAWVRSAQDYREFVWETLIGKLTSPSMPANPRSRKILEDPAYTGYEIVLDVYPDVIAGGILLLPKGLTPGERRPVVVCQHGLEGTPMDTISATGAGFKYYKAFAAALAKQGFITYSPQNPYRGADRFRTIQRKSNPLGRSLFSYILPQHQRTLEWLATLPQVDAKRIGFYGLSYGGKTAVRVPTLLPQYALSICSADFNEWVRKNATNADKYSYLFGGEYEIFEWNMGHVANYAELSSLMAPRPFMVERGHDDGVAPDEWVAWEYAKVRRHYDKLGLGDRTEIEFFNGPHTINGEGTFAFLRRHLKWPVSRPK